MKIVSKHVAIESLQKHIGEDLCRHADNCGITRFKEGKQNKGWRGLTLERLAGLSTSNSPAPNGLGFELKTVAYHQKKGVWYPKETMAITMINPKVLIDTPFFQSHCWNKLKSMVFCAVHWYGKHEDKGELLQVTALDFLETDKLIKEIEADYEFIRDKLIKTGFESLTGADGKWIQARTKGPGHGSISRAFYARKELLKEIIKI
jgi:DNA mismatch repair protein MutH